MMMLLEWNKILVIILAPKYKIYNKPPNRMYPPLNHQSQFEKFYKKGHDKLEKQGNHKQALDNFNKAKKNFNPNIDEFYRLIDLMLDQSRIYKGRRKYDFAKQRIKKCQEMIKEKYKDRLLKEIENLERMECEVKLLSESGQISICEAEKYYEQEDLKKFYESINRCVQYYSKCIEKTSTVLASQALYKILNDSDIYKTWTQLYSELIISSIDPLLAEGQLDQNIQIYKLIYQIGQKMSKFYPLCPHTQSIKRQNSRSLYYRGSMLFKYTAKYKEIEELLINDYKFCLKNGYTQDLANTKVRLMIFYSRIQKLDEARKYLANNEQKQIYNEGIVRDHQKIKKLQTHIKTPQFLSLATKKQQQTLQQLYTLISNPQNCWWSRYITIARHLLPSIHSKQLNYLLCYHMAQCFMNIFDQLNSIHFCGQAMKYCERRSVEGYDVLWVEMKTYENSGKWEKVVEVERELWAMVKTVGDLRDQEARLSQHIDKRKFKRERARYFVGKLGFSEREKKMFQFMERMSRQQQKEDIMEEQINRENDARIQNEDGNQRVSFMRPKNQIKPSTSKKPKNSEVVKQKYQKLCELKKIPIRKSILQKISNLKEQNPFITVELSQFFDLSQGQLEIFLQIVRNQAWDLRNFTIKKGFFEKFVQKIKHEQIKQLRLYNLPRAQQLLQKLLSNLSLIQLIHVQKLDHRLTSTLLKSLLPSTQSKFQQLKILKLKNCHIMDQNLENLPQSHPYLEQLNLSGNELTGLTLAHLNKLPFLHKLNLSSNPLTSCQQLLNNSLTKLKLKKLKSIPESPLPQIKYLHVLDLSSNSSPILSNFLQSLIQYLLQQQLLQLPHFSQLTLKNTNISQSFIMTLNEFVNLCPGIQRLDLRFCWVERGKMEMWEEYLGGCGKKVGVDRRAGFSEPLREFL